MNPSYRTKPPKTTSDYSIPIESDVIYERSGHLHCRRVSAEKNLIGSIYSDINRGYEVARGLDVCAEDFTQPDLRILFEAAASGFVLSNAKQKLQDAGCWDATQIAGNCLTSCRWSMASLGQLVRLWPFMPQVIEHFAHELADLQLRSERVAVGFQEIVSATEVPHCPICANASTSFDHFPLVPIHPRPAANQGKSRIRLVLEGVR